MRKYYEGDDKKYFGEQPEAFKLIYVCIWAKTMKELLNLQDAFNL